MLRTWLMITQPQLRLLTDRSRLKTEVEITSVCWEIFFALSVSILAGLNISQSLFGESRPSNKRHPDLTSSTVHKAALACVPRSSATPISDTCLIAPVASGQKGYHRFLALTLERCL